ncbi:MAG: hypothetical protein QOF19_1670 [Alphaproteobacteria bacterium]|nr:hypothetical protein [Alphaproteobacteria bacterium]
MSVFAPRFYCVGSWRLAHPRDGLACEFLDCYDGLLIDGSNDSDRRSTFTGTAGASDAVDVIVGMMRDIEVKDVADFGNIESARSHIGCNQQLGLTVTELIERRGAGAD